MPGFFDSIAPITPPDANQSDYDRQAGAYNAGAPGGANLAGDPPPPGLTPQQYAAWLDQRRQQLGAAGRNGNIFYGNLPGGGSLSAIGDALGLNAGRFMPQNPYNFSGVGQLPNAADWRSQFEAAQRASDPTAMRQQQAQFLQMLQDQAQGRGPSAAQSQLQKASDANMSQAMSLAAGTQGGSGAGALRDLGYQRAQIGQQMANDSATLRAQEMLSGRALYGQALGQARGQDEQANQFWGQMGFGVDQTQMQGGLQGAQIASQYDAIMQQLRQRAQLAAAGNTAGLINAAGSVLGLGVGAGGGLGK